MSDSNFRMDIHCTDACMNPLALGDAHWASLTIPVEGIKHTQRHFKSVHIIYMFF